MTHEYFDKHNNRITAGMALRHADGDTRKVLPCSDGQYDHDLGFDVTNYASPAFNSSNATLSLLKCSPLSNFDLSEWQIDND